MEFRMQQKLSLKIAGMGVIAVLITFIASIQGNAV
jgi:hypothetical protein